MSIKKYFFADDGTIPNNILPVIHYKNILTLPRLFVATYVKKLFSKNNWGNNWRNGIYTYQHYHTITHEAMGVIRGTTALRLGGKNGITITITKGDVIIIPAGVSHQNLNKEDDVVCVGGYPEGKEFDLNYGKKRERRRALHNIQSLPLPDSDPVRGKVGVPRIWKIIQSKSRVETVIK